MLILAKITTGSAGGYAEYLEGKAQPSQLGDYYLKDGERTEAPGRWAAGAGAFGLDPGRPVTGEQLHALMDVRRPDTGTQLRRAGGTGEAVAAIDATFSAPKSVSAVWALARPQLRERIEQAHETAIDRAMSYATRMVPMLRRRVSRDNVIHEKAAGVVATSWRHTTARAVGGQPPDPQLHSHVLLHAAVRRDGRVVAIDSRSWLVHQREIGAAYRTELARELAGIGFAIQRGTGRGGRYFEIDGVPGELVDRWSSRHHQVQAAISHRLADQQRALQAVLSQGGPAAVQARQRLELLHATGLAPGEERLMATITRAAKVPQTEQDLDREWRQTATAFGLTRERVEVLYRGRQEQVGSVDRRGVLEALTEFDSTFPARDARAVALERSAGASVDDALAALKALRASDEILLLADQTGTTRAHRGREQTVVAIAERLAAGQLAPLPAALTARHTERLDRELAAAGGRLSAEQRVAIELACGPRPLVVIQGQAGTGKSTTLTGIARAHQDAGREIIVTSTAALAAERLAAELARAGVKCEAYSTSGLSTAARAGRVRLGADTTVIHDEAALASTREQLGLLQAVEEADARLIEIGDPRQNQPVGAAGLWTHVEAAANRTGARAQLTINQRARHPADRRDQARFRSGDTEAAIRGYAARDRVHLHSDQRRAEDAALDAAHTDRTGGRQTVVIAQTSNEHLDALNARAQAIRQQNNELGSETFPLPGRPYALRPGDEIQIRRTIHHPEHGPVRNGTTARILAADHHGERLDLALTSGQQLSLDRPLAEAADLRLAYVQHPFPAQGITTDTAHLIAAEHATQEGTYVALTRARHDTHLYAAQAGAADPDVDQVAVLAQRLTHTEPELPSISTPLAHEHTVSTDPDRPPESVPATAPETHPAPAFLELEPPAPDAPVSKHDDGGRRRWPVRERTDDDRLLNPEVEAAQLVHDRSAGWTL